MHFNNDKFPPLTNWVKLQVLTSIKLVICNRGGGKSYQNEKLFWQTKF